MNKPVSTLDLSGLDRFKPGSLLDDESTGLRSPSEISLDLIDLDPVQPRRTLSKESLVELAESIAVHGVLEPVSLREHPTSVGRYIVNRGERRVRAAFLAKLRAIPAFLDDRLDPFAQAAENLHREDMSPFDLATFIAEREAEGHSRAEIARRLSQPKSAITHAASLLDAPHEVRDAYESGRVRDVRILYELTTASRDDPLSVQALIAQGTPIGRSVARTKNLSPVAPRTASKGECLSVQRDHMVSTGLVVEYQGREALLRWDGWTGPSSARIVFADEQHVDAPLAELKIKAWSSYPEVI